VGARGAEARVRGPTEGICGRQPGRSPRLASKGRAVWLSNAALRPGTAGAGSVESLVNGRSILRIYPQSSYLAGIAPRTGKAARGAGAGRPALDTADRPARAARLLRPRIVSLCPLIMRDRPEKVKPRFVPAPEPHRPARPSGATAQPGSRASRPSLAGGTPTRASAPKSFGSSGFGRGRSRPQTAARDGPSTILRFRTSGAPSTCRKVTVGHLGHDRPDPAGTKIRAPAPLSSAG